MMKNLKRNLMIVVVLLFICAAVGLNWSYNNKWGDSKEAYAEAEDAAMEKANTEYAASLEDGKKDAETGKEKQTDTKETGAEDAEVTENADAGSSDYFSSARLTREQSRDEATALLQETASSDSASQEVIDAAVEEISAMASWTMQEAQLENMILSKDFTDCIVFINSDTVTVAVPAPEEGLSEADVARLLETITSETDYTASQVRVVEVK